jgi:hypothetical protein
MRRRFLLLVGSYVLAGAASLAFGSTPAAAAPQCEPQSCDQYCRSVGAVFGYCGPYFTGCICEY